MTPEEMMQQVTDRLSKIGQGEQLTQEEAKSLLAELQDLLDKLTGLVDKTGKAAEMITELKARLASGEIPAEAIGPQVLEAIEAYKQERETENTEMTSAFTSAKGEVQLATSSLDEAIKALEDAMNA